MNDKPITGRMYKLLCLESGRNEEESAKFNEILKACRPHTKGIREKEFVRYYDLETDYTYKQNYTFNRKSIDDLSSMLTELKMKYTVTFDHGT